MISHPFGDAVVITRPVAVALSSVAALTPLSFAPPRKGDAT
jgi:hypothetical protein